MDSPKPLLHTQSDPAHGALASTQAGTLKARGTQAMSLCVGQWELRSHHGGVKRGPRAEKEGQDTA